eukprot:CAMPEP_0171307394 /NCGR_PEP_ID=MMETSP0816-20121228/17411_1 /TAXON_ID=420281 /ORGANISM="Proboscia inermis, Strain CCAP1064/1" /LENGTH=54 /DNA_ID=CAMNT_0011789525 /DNA_START=116 /DNA_END=280 /DNA_ORIENTATION=-
MDGEVDGVDVGALVGLFVSGIIVGEMEGEVDGMDVGFLEGVPEGKISTSEASSR